MHIYEVLHVWYVNDITHTHTEVLTQKNYMTEKKLFLRNKYYS